MAKHLDVAGALGEKAMFGSLEVFPSTIFQGRYIPVSFREGRKNPSTHGIGIVMIDMIKYQ